MGRMVTVEEWAEIHGKTPATVRRKIHANAWPDAKQATLDGKLVWMLDEDWLWPRAMTPAKQAKMLCDIRYLMPPVVYATTADGVVICMVTCTKHTHIARGVTADEMNDLWKAPRRLVRPHRQPCNMAGCTRWLIRDPTTREESCYIMPTPAKGNTARKKAPQSAQERPAAPVVQFPLPFPKPRQTAPQEAQAVICECSSDAVRIRLLPDPAAVLHIMDETFGPLGWTRRYYFADGRLWCGVGVYNPVIGNYAVKDAAAPAGKFKISNPDKWKENGSFLAAAALWGVGGDLMALPSMTFAADQVDIGPVQKPGKRPSDPPTVVGYRLHHALTVDKLLRADDGSIIGVQLLQGERKVVWQAE